MIKNSAKNIVDIINNWSIKSALSENRLDALKERLSWIVPDISGQESSEEAIFNKNIELKRRSLQAFQCALMLKALGDYPRTKITVVDIGDSAGTHMLYLKELTRDRLEIESISVNLDPRSISKIEKRGLKAVLCRAEDIDLGEKEVDLFTSFEMLEHLHNPALFLRNLAKRSRCGRMAITVPYLKQSRVGLHHIRNKIPKVIYAEDEHIFELSPRDWTLLILHSGWRIVYSEVYYQYPRRWPLLRTLLSHYWRAADFEGFWGAILEKDMVFSDRYQDWQDERKSQK